MATTRSDVAEDGSDMDSSKDW